jgi:hypothetical protein
MRNFLTQTLSICAFAFILTFLAGCQTNHPNPTQPVPVAAQTPATPAAPAPVAAAPTTPTAPATPPTPVAVQGVIRIKAGSDTPFTDSSGNVWQAELGFNGGDMTDRDPGTTIVNTKDPGLFLSEHYGMDSFSCSVPNGKYTAKLYFAETYDDITGPGQRVFSFNVQGHDFKDFDVWAKSGGFGHPYMETVPVEVTDGKFVITFTSNIENPEINAIELIPQM